MRSKERRSNSPRPSTVPWARWGGIAVVALAIAGGLYAWMAQAEGNRTAVTEFMHLHGLGIPTWSPEAVYVSTHAGLIRLTPEGAWEHVSEKRHDFMGFQANPTRDGILYSSGHPAPESDLPNPVGFMVSQDRGATWEIRSLGGRVDFHASAVQPTDGDVYYGHAGDLYRTSDGGETWTRTSRDRLTEIGGIYSLAVHAEDSSTIFAGTELGLWRSSDAGDTWQAVLRGAPVTAIATTANDPGRLLAYAVASDAGLLESTDGGASWAPLGFFAEEGDAVGYIAQHPSDRATLVLGTFGASVHRSRDGGRTWTVLASSGTTEEHPADHAGEHEH